jgi:predicted ThiF/HesA family dinucleotide-utilizing enzyme
VTWAVKLEISTPDCEEVYETGKNEVRTIEINTEDGIIEITQDRSEWDHIIIPINTIKSVKYKADKPLGPYRLRL